LGDEQKQWIQTWMDAVSNEHSEDICNDILTSRVTNLESALHSAKDELRSESQMRVKREMILDRLQEQLKTKEDELSRIRMAMDESNYPTTTTKKSLPDRTKSAPHFGGVQRK
ncbi:unnamed protein product, partial [Rotaria magnacalcarata]